MRRGRPILAAVCGVFLGLFLGFDLLMFKVISSDSVLFLVLPLVLMVAGIALGAAAPLGRKVTPPEVR